MPRFAGFPDVRGELEAAGIRQMDVADRLAVDDSWLSRVLRGYRRAPEGFEQKLRQVIVEMKRDGTLRPLDVMGTRRERR